MRNTFWISPKTGKGGNQWACSLQDRRAWPESPSQDRSGEKMTYIHNPTEPTYSNVQPYKLLSTSKHQQLKNLESYKPTKLQPYNPTL